MAVEWILVVVWGVESQPETAQATRMCYALETPCVSYQTEEECEATITDDMRKRIDYMFRMYKSRIKCMREGDYEVLRLKQQRIIR